MLYVAPPRLLLLVYSSERPNTRATHIQCCQPRELFAGHQSFPANRVRGATASGYVDATIALASSFVKFPRGTDGFHVGAVTNGILATNDFTMVRTGIYDLELTVQAGYRQRTPPSASSWKAI